MALVKFVTGTATQFQALSPKDANTLYFITDERRIYKGDIPYSGGIYKTVTAFPATGDAAVNTLYVNTATGEVAYFNGTNMQTVVPATGKSISGTGDDTHLATTKAVVDYVATQLATLDVSTLAGRVTTLEGEMDTVQNQITTINGDGEGSIAKAKTDAIAAAKSYTDQEVAKKANLEHTHEIANVNGLQAALDGKANKATTLAGYGITDAYTQTQTDTKIAEAVAAAPHLKRAIVEELPEVGSADANTIYMVPQGDGTVDDPGTATSHYNEYMLINGAFELVGSSQVDLTGYATETFVTNAIGALDKADSAQEGQYVSAVSQENGVITVTRAALPTAPEITEGSTNGTIAVGDEDVPVHGLGSAAYTDSGAYATAAQGALADTALQKADITTGATQGTIAVEGTDVAVNGLKSAAFAETTAFDAAGAADQALTDAKAYVDTALSWGTL